METNTVVFEMKRGDQIFKNPVQVRTENGSYKKIGYARGLQTIEVDKHPAGTVYELMYFPYKRIIADDPLLVEFLKGQQKFSEEPNQGRLWIHDAKENAKRENEVRKIYVSAMNYIDSLSQEDLNIKAFSKIGTNILSLSEDEIRQALYNIADENPQEILDLKEDSAYDFIGKAIYNQVIELKKGGFYIYGERQHLLYQAPSGVNSKEMFIDFLKTKEGKDVYNLIKSKMPESYQEPKKPINSELRKVAGVGATLESFLIEAKINSIEHLASFDEALLKIKLEEIGYVIPKMLKLDGIINNAKRLLESENND